MRYMGLIGNINIIVFGEVTDRRYSSIMNTTKKCQYI